MLQTVPGKETLEVLSAMEAFIILTAASMPGHLFFLGVDSLTTMGPYTTSLEIVTSRFVVKDRSLKEPLTRVS
jgi:hypothetical protein